MGLSWQQGPLATGAIGRFLVPDPLPERMLFAEPSRRRMRVRYGGAWIADSEDVVLLHEPGRYPVAYFPLGDTAEGALQPSEHTTRHRDLGPTDWYTVRTGERSAPRAAWQYTELPLHAGELKGRVAFAWRAMDAFYEEDERIVGHAADTYHRIDIRRTSRHLVVRVGDRVVADSTRPLVLYESGFAPAGTSRAPTSTSPRSPRPRAGPSARTRAWPATTTSTRHGAGHGRTRTHGVRSGASPEWCRSNRTRSRCVSTAPDYAWNRGRT